MLEITEVLIYRSVLISKSQNRTPKRLHADSFSSGKELYCVYGVLKRFILLPSRCNSAQWLTSFTMRLRQLDADFRKSAIAF